MLSEALKQQYPDIQFSPLDEPGKVTLVDDGSGVRIEHWNRSETKPDEADVLAAFDRAEYVRKTTVGRVYVLCREKIDGLSIGYSQSEIATWPAMASEIVLYKDNGAVGPTMRAVIEMGPHTADTLSDALMPKISYERVCLSNREAHVKALLAYSTLDQITGHDVHTGWPTAI